MQDVLSPAHPPHPALCGAIGSSFAYKTIKDRLPVILTRCVDDIARALHALTLPPHSLTVNDAVLVGGKQIIAEIGRLRYELQRDREILPLPDTGDAEEDVDVGTWNAVLQLFQSDPDAKGESSNGPHWFQAPWLIVECYMYRAIRAMCVRAGPYWAAYDPFRGQKREAFLASHVAVFALARRAEELIAAIPTRQGDTDWECEVLSELVHASLWGNATDLSLLLDLKLVDVHRLQHSVVKGSEAAGANGSDAPRKHMVVVDETSVLWNCVRWFHRERIDIVLDNAGLELFADLVLADWLVSTDRARTVVLHAKRMPWFVSDAMVDDIDWLLDVCSGLVDLSETFPAEAPAELRALSLRLASHFRDGKLTVTADPFWTLPHAYYHLPDLAPVLHRALHTQSSMVIFKGDLNYRKLVYDCQWPTATSFPMAIGPAWEGAKATVVALRTCKSDVVVGLRDGQDEALTTEDGEWMVNGQYGLVQLAVTPGSPVHE